MAKAKGKKSAPAKTDGKRKGGGSGFHLKLWLFLIALLVCAGGIGFSYVPGKSVPASLGGIYDFCLRSRNTAIVRMGLDLQRYEDSAVVRPAESPEIKVYFAPSKKIAKGLADFIRSAKSTVDVCIYDLDLNEVADALIDVKKSGASVRVVTDTDNRMMQAVDRLNKAGIPVRTDRKPTIMHNKFVIADARRVWTGSFNFTENGAEKNDNNALIIESPRVAACYLAKFSEYMNGRFSTAAAEKTVGGRSFMGKVPVEVAFSPSDGVAAEICDRLSYARKKVRVMAFVLTSEPIAEKLGELSKRGVDVECLLDRGQAKSRYSRDQYLLGCGVRIFLSPNTRGKMHHKVIVIDDETVITGSYNFSENAETGNDENILIVKNAELAKLFDAEYERCRKGTKGY